MTSVAQANSAKPQTPSFLDWGIPTVNVFLTRVCNYRCRFCFATFHGLRNQMPFDEARALINELARSKVERVTFVGGEPTLVDNLPDLLKHAKAMGLSTSIVTNASRLNPSYFDRIGDALDILAVSIDSANDATEAHLGRGTGNHVGPAVRALQEARRRGIFTKINTVVTRLNVSEDFSPVLEATRPDRWKVFQMLPVRGQNDGAGDLEVAASEFEDFCRRHAHWNPIAEENRLMRDSYVMIDPEGRIFQNGQGSHEYGPRVLDVGLRRALESVGWDAARFVERGGAYSIGNTVNGENDP